MGKPNSEGLTFQARPQAESDRRLRELILYLGDKCAQDPHFGAVKIDKLIYQIDMLSFVEFGIPVTGAEYMRQPWGPVPRRFLPVKESMIEERDVAEREHAFYSRSQKRLIPLRSADLACFSGPEVALMDRVIEENWEKNATEMSDETHGRAWNIAGEDGNAIPYEAAYISDQGLTFYDLQHTQSLAKHLGWDQP